jgi:cardiolipin synthase A/B
MSAPRVTAWQWLRNGDEAFPAMLDAIATARVSIRLETYCYADDSLGRRVRAALVEAQRRGVVVRVLTDGIGSIALPGDFWQPLIQTGGAARTFNPVALRRFGIRDHRKLLVCDERVAFVGGFNISAEYEGDGVTRGWCDLGLRLEGLLVSDLVSSFEVMFALAEFRHKRLVRLWRAQHKRAIVAAEGQLLLGGPGRGANPIRRAMQHDLARAREVQIISAYFLPTWRIRRALARVARRGGRVQLILPAKSDVALSQLAGRSLYRRLLKAGAEVHEFAPQILHAKLLVLDEAVYVGSANLDPRSLSINYELMLRFENPRMTREAREIVAEQMRHCRRIDRAAWARSRSLWMRLKERCAYWLLAQFDPHVARWQWRSLPD